MSEERRDNDTRQSLVDMVADIQKVSTKMDTSLFGPEGQPEMGFVHQTRNAFDKLDARLTKLDDPANGRVSKLEHRVLYWAGALAVLIPAAAWAANHYLK